MLRLLESKSQLATIKLEMALTSENSGEVAGMIPDAAVAETERQEAAALAAELFTARTALADLQQAFSTAEQAAADAENLTTSTMCESTVYCCKFLRFHASGGKGGWRWGRVGGGSF